MHNSKAVIVLGMHRSGTSALAGMLSLLGIQFGRSLFPPQADNPRGYWEHREIVDLDDRMLMALGSSWDDMRGSNPTLDHSDFVILFGNSYET